MFKKFVRSLYKMETDDNVFDKFDKVFVKRIRDLDALISSNLHSAGIETRSARSNGLWCFTLLPTILYLYSKMYDVPPVYLLATYVSISLAFYCMLFILFMSISCLVLSVNQWGGCIPSGTIGCLLVYIYVSQDIVSAALLTLPCTFLLSHLLRTLLAYPKTFTIGEAMIVAQMMVLSAVVLLAHVLYDFNDEKGEMDHLLNTVLGIVLSTVGLIVTALSYMKPEQRNVTNLGYLLGGAALLGLMQMWLLIGYQSIFLVFYVLFMNQQRMKLLSFWLCLVLASVFVVSARTAARVRATTTTRKTFHVMAALVFTSGVLVDLSLMKFAAVIGLALIILIEALRKSNIEPFSSALQSAFLVYCDEKDRGAFALSAIYLYVGLACPLWLVPAGAASAERLAGVLSTGVGDTAASWFGSRYGSLKWPAGSRTVEGTLFNILSQIATVYALTMFDLLQDRNVLIRTTVAATVSGLVEARTTQVDNLILPLATIIAYQATFVLG